MVLDEFPEPSGIRKGGNSLEHNLGGTHRQRAVCNIAVPGYPAYIGCAPEYVRGFVIEYPLHAQDGAQKITTRGVLHALRFAGRTGGVEGKQWMLGINPFRLARIALVLDKVVPPDIARGVHWHTSLATFIHHYGF